MNGAFIKFANEINFSLTPIFNDVKIISASLKQDIFHLAFDCFKFLPIAELSRFLAKINQNFKYKVQPKFIVTSQVWSKTLIFEYMQWIICDFLKEPNFWVKISHLDLEITLPKVIFLATSPQSFDNFDKIIKRVTSIMDSFGFKQIVIEFQTQKNGEIENVIEKTKQDAFGSLADIFSQDIGGLSAKEFKPNNYKNTYSEVKISELQSGDFVRVIVKGLIFSVNHRFVKNGYLVSEFKITDNSDAIGVKFFTKGSKDQDAIQDFQVNDCVTIQGEYQIDAYSKEPILMGRKCTKDTQANSSRMDNSQQKRVELGVRTRMSTMDGVLDIKTLVSRLKDWNHEAVAIVDTDSVQAFPEFFHALKSSKIKGIYGATINTISRENQATKNVNENFALKSSSYLVFDIETTGLSPQFDEIIEFGAVLISDGVVVQSWQFFIKPTQPISGEITNLTGITNELVKDGISEHEAMLKIYEIIRNYPLVAHNATFDLGFLTQKFAQYEIVWNPTNNVVIDTLIVARMIHPDAKRFRLENVATRYGVTYDSTIAHRADYDAKVLQAVWQKMLIDLESLQITTIFDLKNYQNQEVYAKAYSYEVSILAKNQTGLKNLFKLLSNSHTKTFYGGRPIVFFEDLAARKDLLLGSGALRSRLVDRLFYGSERDLLDELVKYDYIEVQPPQNFSHYILKGFDMTKVKLALKKLVHLAISQGKIVVATGDVRYIDPNDKVYHEIYINAKGLGGARHYLYSYDKTKEYTFPDQHFLTTPEMLEAFAFLDDDDLVQKIVVTNSHKIAAMIEPIEVIKKNLYPPKMIEAPAKLEEIVYQNAFHTYGKPLPEFVRKRLERELEPIKKYGFAVIYYIAHLLVAKSLSDGYLVGSRGSVGSSLVATMANITEVNPLEPHYLCKICKYTELGDGHLNSGYDLPLKDCPHCFKVMSCEGQNIPFETFLGFNADKTPDIDLNFSGDYQPTIHNEVKRLFGDEHAFRAGTISTVADKTAYGYVLAYAEDHQKKFSRAYIDFLARGVAGTKRTTGQHPGGIIVIPKDFDVEDFTPINFPANDTSSSWQTTHFDFQAIHDNVLKLDLLGHDDPTAIRLLERQTGVNVKRDISFKDEKIISLFSSPMVLGIKPEDINNEHTGVMGIPEFGTKFVRTMLKKAKVTSFGDLIAVSGLSHGEDVWANNAETLVSKENKQLSEVISCRDNIMNDLISKGVEPILAFEIMEQVRKGRSITPKQEEVLTKAGVPLWYIDSLKKIKYMFPKAHATAYVMMAWRVAWFKIYQPLAYYATFFTTRAEVFDLETMTLGKTGVVQKLKELEGRRNKKSEVKLSNKEEALIPILELLNEAFARKIRFCNIDLKFSLATEWRIDNENQQLYPPFIALDGLGIAVAASIVSAREVSHFTSIEDFQNRTSINKTILEKLKKLGVLKHLDESNQLSLDLFGV